MFFWLVSATFFTLAISDAVDICTRDEDFSHTWVRNLSLALITAAIGFDIPTAEPNPTEDRRRILLEEFFA